MVPLRVAASLRFVASLVALMALAWAGSPALAVEPVLDHSVDACDDFFHFACNAWIKDHPIPEDQSRWTAFDELNIHTRDSLHDLLEEAVAHPTGDSAKPGAYYAACMDEAGIEARGLKPLQGELDRIAALSDKTALPVLVAALQRNGSDVLFDFDSGIDDSDPVHDIAVLGQGGLGLPDRDQYVKTDPKSVELRAKYRAHVARMLVLSGMDEAGSGAAADAVIAFETSLAQHALTRVQRRDPKAVFHKLPIAALTSAAPDFAWDRYFTAIGVPTFKLLNIREPDFVDNLGKLLDATPLETIRTYLRWQVLHRSAPFLPSAFVDENFAFYGKILQGKQVIEPRWRRCVVATDAALGEALGKLYVEHYFPPTNRALVRHLIGDVRAAFRRDIDTLPWMGAVTRKRALEKLDAMVEKIAYPDK
jgi:endothelin-converting enzyme/putative endopeptidase